jgi:DNA (cytosine-5)-methyltransferase 1
MEEKLIKKTVVELFAGVGGFRVGLNDVELKNDEVIEKDTFNFVWANQWEPATKAQDAYNCYITRFGEKDTSNEDINLVNKQTIPNHALLVGGFPCQDYSVAQSLVTSNGIEGKKGVLWWHINEVLSQKKPPFVLLENVDRLLRSPAKQRGRDFGIMLRCFYEQGYDVQWRVINAAEYGFGQRRRRIFIFAYSNKTKYGKLLRRDTSNDTILSSGIFAKVFPVKDEFGLHSSISIKESDILTVSQQFKSDFYNAGVMKDGNITSIKTEPVQSSPTKMKELIVKRSVDDKYILTEAQIKKMEYLKGAKRVPRTRPNGESYYYSEGAMVFPENLNAPARTMLTSEKSINRSTHVITDVVTKKPRFILPVEAERINGFPDNWTNTGMLERKRYFMMGNALVVGIVRRLGREISQIIDNE